MFLFITFVFNRIYLIVSSYSWIFNNGHVSQLAHKILKYLAVSSWDLTEPATHTTAPTPTSSLMPSKAGCIMAAWS